MCGRFALALPHDEIRHLPGHAALHVGEWINQDQFVPRYNVAPHSQAPVIRRAGVAHNAAGPSSSTTSTGSPECGSESLVLHTMKWGLVPHWFKTEPAQLNTINARSENLTDGGSMWDSIKGKRRCVVVAQGYYEWLKKGKERLPHFTRPKDKRLMLLAGLYDRATLEGQSEPLWTFTIVTTAANKEFEWLHDRQPVILSSDVAVRTWLDTSAQSWSSELSALLNPYNDPDCPLECYAVPKEVGKVGTESPSFIEPVAKRKDGIEAMLSKQTATGSSSKSPHDVKPSVASPARNKRKHEIEPGSPQKKTKVSRAHADATGASTYGLKEEDQDSDIEIISPPPGSQTSNKSSRPAATENNAPNTSEAQLIISSPVQSQKDNGDDAQGPSKRGQLMSPPTSQPSSQSSPKKQTPASPKKSKKKVGVQAEDGSAKITSFFTKK